MKPLIFLCLIPCAAEADSVIATRTLRAQTILAQGDMAVVDAAIPGALTVPAAAEGMELRVTVYAGRAIRVADIGPPAIVDRNQIVPMAYSGGALSILTGIAANQSFATGLPVDVKTLVKF